MAKAEIYQIFYSEQTRARVDPGFIALDNLSNERPDWREYWPVRNYLLNHTLEPNTFYGFFSSKFGLKTQLNSAAVYALIDANGADVDVITFSPFLAHIALYLNIIEQAIACHGIPDTFKQCAALVAPEFRVDRCVMSSLNTVFCNFFVAKREFWNEWFRQAERLFAIAEQGTTALGRALNAIVSYVVAVPEKSSGDTVEHSRTRLCAIPDVPAKVFVIERLASLLLWSNRNWRVKSLNHMTGSRDSTPAPEHLMLNALKLGYAQTGAEPYLDVFRQLRLQIASRHAQATHQAPAGPTARNGATPGAVTPRAASAPSKGRSTAGSASACGESPNVCAIRE